MELPLLVGCAGVGDTVSVASGHGWAVAPVTLTTED